MTQLGWNELLFLPIQGRNDDAGIWMTLTLHELYGQLLGLSDEEFRQRVSKDVLSEGGAGLDSFLHFFPRAGTGNAALQQHLSVLYTEVFRVLLRMFLLDFGPATSGSSTAADSFRDVLWNQTRLLDMISLYGHLPLLLERFTAAPQNADNVPLLVKLLAMVRETQEIFADADSPEFSKILQSLLQWESTSRSAPAKTDHNSLRDSVESILVPRSFDVSDIGVSRESQALRESILYEVLYDDDPDENRDDMHKFDLTAAVENEDEVDQKNRGKQKPGPTKPELSDEDEDDGEDGDSDDDSSSGEEGGRAGTSGRGRGRGRGRGGLSRGGSSSSGQPKVKLSAAALAKRSGRGRLNRTKRREAGAARKGGPA